MSSTKTKVSFGSSPKASSSGISHSHSDRATGNGFAGSTLRGTSKGYSDHSDSNFRSSGFGSGSHDSEGTRSTGRGYGASNLGSSSKQSNNSISSGNRGYSTSFPYSDLYFMSNMMSVNNELRTMRQEQAIHNELSQLEQKRDHLEHSYHLDVPNYYEYTQEHPKRTPKGASLLLMALGAIGGGIASGALMRSYNNPSILASSALAGALIGGVLMNSLTGEDYLDVKREHVQGYKNLLDTMEIKAKSPPQTKVDETQPIGRVIESEQEKSVALT